MSTEDIKRALGKKAAELIQDGMRVGIGTGSTAYYFIVSLIERCHQGLNIQAVATSDASYQLAKQGGIPLIDINRIERLDIAVDGADEVDHQKRMIKGAGGALLREKIIAAMSQEFIILVDHTKLVDQLGKKPLPVEIVPFGLQATRRHLIDAGFQGDFRKKPDGSLYITDGGNVIFDVHFATLPSSLEKVEKTIQSIPGVIETGLFFNLAKKVFVGYSISNIETL